MASSQVIVRTFTGEQFFVDFSPEATCMDVKYSVRSQWRLEHKEDLPPAQQRLVVLPQDHSLPHVVLDDVRTLASQNVTSDTLVHLVVVELQWENFIDEWLSGKHDINFSDVEHAYGGIDACDLMWGDAYTYARRHFEEGKWQLVLGICHYRQEQKCGFDVERSIAVPWFYHAARQGIPLANYWLGLCHTRGDPERKMQFYQIAAEQGVVQAQRVLARTYARAIKM